MKLTNWNNVWLTAGKPFFDRSIAACFSKPFLDLSLQGAGCESPRPSEVANCNLNAGLFWDFRLKTQR